MKNDPSGEILRGQYRLDLIGQRHFFVGGAWATSFRLLRLCLLANLFGFGLSVRFGPELVKRVELPGRVLSSKLGNSLFQTPIFRLQLSVSSRAFEPRSSRTIATELLLARLQTQLFCKPIRISHEQLL